MKGLRTGMLMLAVWLGLTGVGFAKQVYFRDGSVLDCESFWRRNGVIVVKVNRDVLLEFAPGEVNMDRTMERAKRKPASAARQGRPAPAKAPVAVESAAPAPAVEGGHQVPGVQQAQGVKAPAPAATVAPAGPKPAPPAGAVAPAPAAPPATEPAAAAPAAPLTKEEVERRSKENVEMMAEAVKKGDPELMKKAVEAQRSLAQRQKEAGGAAAVAKGPRHEPPWFKYFLIMVASGLLVLVSMWIVFSKAGESGVKSIIPIYNYYVLMLISGKPGWWCLLVFIPVVGIATHLLAMLALAEKFGRSPVFAVGLVFLPMIFFPLLAFGASQYGELREQELDFTFSEEPPQG